mmetsp:Transcript_9272/g.10244  ORF Transcript_9272/g.10244 Transcript_9272/m.10244 type:complete len:358 (-) Transcript_9272:58-1131(-)
MSLYCQLSDGNRSSGCRAFFLFESILLIFLHFTCVANARIHTGGFDFDSMPAMFGRRWNSNIEHEAQLIVIPNDAYLCSQQDMNVANFTAETKTRNNELPVALLVSRGACSFEEKARTAMSMKASFVIVYDNHPHNKLISMSGSYQGDIDVGMMFVSHETELELRHMIRKASSNTTIVGGLFITMDGEVPYYYSDYEAGDFQDWILELISVFSALLASIGCVLTCLQAGFIPTNGRHLFSSNRRMNEEQVLKLPIVNHGDEVEGMPQTSCPICLEDYEEGESLRQLPCYHMFHTECIIPWLERHSVCPLCKADVSPPQCEKKSARCHTWSNMVFRVLSHSQRRTLVSNIDLDEGPEN